MSPTDDDEAISHGNFVSARCPYCLHGMAQGVEVMPGRPVRYPVPSHYHCEACGFQMEAEPLTRRGLRRLIVASLEQLRRQVTGDDDRVAGFGDEPFTGNS